MSAIEKLRVLIVVGTRPEIIRMSRIISKVEEFCDLTLVHTGQNYDYELNEIFFQDLKIKQPDYFLSCASEGNSPAETIGNIIIKIDHVIEDVDPDAMIILGDTNSALSSLPAKRRQIPIFHLEAGNRCFDERVPEEINRKIVDHISDINLTYSDISREYLLREGIKPQNIIKIGSPMFEILNFHIENIENSKILKKLDLKEREFFLVSFHRQENIENANNIAKIVEILNSIVQKFNLPIIVSTHPRTRKAIDKGKFKISKEVVFINPLGFFDYIKLQKTAKIVISDSGTITEEASILKFPAINLRETNERPEGMEEATTIMTGLDVKNVMRSISIIENSSFEDNCDIVDDYNVHNVSDKVLRIVHSYTGFVNRENWRKFQ